jgi:hypothetical protein
MKRETIKKLIAVAGCVTLFSAVNVGISAAASSDSAITSGEVIAAASVTKSADLSFGKLAAGAAASKITVATTGTRTKDSGDAQLAGGTISAAAFDVSGQAGNSYNVTLPNSFTVTDGSHTMTVDGITPDGPLTGLSGAVTIKVGATLNVGAAQSTGVYTNATGLTATVAYQ